MRDVGGVKLIGRVLDGVPAKELKGMADELKKKLGSGVVALVGVEDGKASAGGRRDRRPVEDGSAPSIW